MLIGIHIPVSQVSPLQWLCPERKTLCVNSPHFPEFPFNKDMELGSSSHSGCRNVCDSTNLRTKLTLGDKNRAFGMKENSSMPLLFLISSGS